MASVSRAQRQARTRELLVDTAERLFLRDGLAATSLDRVALEAGFSKGAVYSNFAHKDELCLAVLDRVAHDVLGHVVTAFEADGGLDQRLAAFESWARRALGEPRWTALEVEYASRARTSVFVADALRERHRGHRDAIATLVRDSAERYDLALAMPADDVATALLSLGTGLGLARATDPDLPVAVLSDTIRLLLGVGHPVR